jgi:hypothetical protein
VYHVAAARFYLAEQDFEKLLTITFPDKLDFSTEPKKKKKLEESTKRFMKYFTDKTKAVVSTRDKYKSIVDGALEGGAAINGAAWAIASAARYGQIYQNFADQLFTAEIPKEVRTGPFAEDATAAFCDALVDGIDGPDGKKVFAGVNVLEEESVVGFSFCLDTSLKLNWFNDWTKLCERELAQIRPQDFPTAGEIRSKSDEVPDTLDTQPIATELSDGSKKTTTSVPKTDDTKRTAKAN